MTIAVISDVHGNYPALEQVLRSIDAAGCTKIYSLGDVAGYYCLVNECIDALRGRGVVNLMGNHEHYLITDKPCPRSKSATACLDYQRRVLTAENLDWLRSSSLRLQAGDISMVHAGWNEPLEEYIDRLTPEYFADKSATYFFSGHTHVQALEAFGNKTYCNPGSVGQPRDGDPRAAWACLIDGIAHLERVEYDIDATASAMKAAGFDEYFYRDLYRGARIGGGISKFYRSSVEGDRT
jgi:predicted phosphodiesterase